MSDDLRSLPAARPRGAPTTISIDGEVVRAFVGEPVALALFAAGIRLLARSPKYHRPRGLFCASGHCGSCLMRVDGRPNVRACVTPVVPELSCQRQNAFPDAEVDLLAAADWLFPGGMDHHRLMTGSRIGNELFVKLVRQLGGSGLLPERPAPDALAARDEIVDLCVVGAGPAGLTAARAVAAVRPSLRVLVLDENPAAGGSLTAEPEGHERANALAAAATSAGARLLPGATAIGVYPADVEPGAGDPDDARGVLAAATADGLLRVHARRFLYATGAYDQNLPLPDNDRPGVLTARAVGRLAFTWGIRPGRRVIIVTPPGPRPAYLERLAAGLAARAVPVEFATELAAPSGPKLDLRLDVVAMGALPAPASELPRQHGAAVVLDLPRGGFRALRDDDGKAAPGIYVAGDAAGYLGPEGAAADGARVGAALAKQFAGR